MVEPLGGQSYAAASVSRALQRTSGPHSQVIKITGYHGPAVLRCTEHAKEFPITRMGHLLAGTASNPCPSCKAVGPAHINTVVWLTAGASSFCMLLTVVLHLCHVHSQEQGGSKSSKQEFQVLRQVVLTLGLPVAAVMAAPGVIARKVCSSVPGDAMLG